MKKIVFLLVAVTCLSCISDDDISIGVNLRVTNLSDFELEDLTVYTSMFETDDFLSIESLLPGESSNYTYFEEILPQQGVKASVNGETLIRIALISDTDVPLIKGKFSCLIDVVENNNQQNTLLVTLIKHN